MWKMHKMMEYAAGLKPPWSYIANPNIATADFSLPSDVIGCEIITSAAGTIYIDTSGVKNVAIYCVAGVANSVQVSKLRTAGSTITTGIQVNGRYIADLMGTE